MLTAAGDQSVALWDTNTAQLLGSFLGHRASVKSVSPWPACHDVFASGGRDGAICLFDSRANGRCSYRDGLHRVQQGTTHAPVAQMQARRCCS